MTPLSTVTHFRPPDPFIWTRVREAVKTLPKALYSQFIKRCEVKSYENLFRLDNEAKVLQLVLNFSDWEVEPFLHSALRHAETTTQDVEDLLSLGSNPNQLNAHGQTALDVAIEVNAAEMAQYLLRNRAIASDPESLENWIKEKSSSEVAGFLHAGFEPTSTPSDTLELPIRVLWIHSSINWLAAIQEEIRRPKTREEPFFRELAKQRSEEPLFQLLTCFIDRTVFLALAWGVYPDFPFLKEGCWSYLSLCMEAGFVTNEMLSQSLEEPLSIPYYLYALDKLPKEKPVGITRTFYKEYIRKLKFELFGTLRKPTEEILTQMAERLEWHQEEWLFIQRYYETSVSPKAFSDDIDPVIECFLLGNVQKAREGGLPLAFVEEGRLLIEENEVQNGIDLLKVAVCREIVIAGQLLALSPNIPITNLKDAFPSSHIKITSL
ncbi:MAG: hypothetical protein ACK5MA_03910, partial [Parachlamydiaceae bacterium]